MRLGWLARRHGRIMIPRRASVSVWILPDDPPEVPLAINVLRGHIVPHALAEYLAVSN